MTIYVAEITSAQVGAAFNRVVLTPTTLPVKIVKVEVSGSSTFNIYRSTGVGTGGTSFPLSPLRTGSGAPPATATAKYNVTSVSGTFTYFAFTLASGSTFQPTASLMVPAGTVFTIESGNGGAANGLVAIHLDEQRLQGGF